MHKKIISAALAALLAVSACSLAASADEVAVEKSGESTGTFSFAPDWDATTMYFYVWDVTADPVLYATKDGWTDANPWGSKKIKGTKKDDGSFESFEITFPENHDFNVIFYDPDSGNQTFDCVLGPQAIGDTAEVTGERLQNPVDSEKDAVSVKFKNCGLTARKVITSTGDIVGETITEYMNPAKDVAEFVLNRLGAIDKSGEPCVTEDKVANAISEFGTTADEVWEEYLKFEGSENYNPEEAEKVINPYFDIPPEDSLTPEEVESLRPSSEPIPQSKPETVSSSEVSSKGDTSSKADVSSKADASSKNTSSSTSSKSDSGVKSPKTGYTSTAFVLFLLIALSAAASLAISRRNREE